MTPAQGSLFGDAPPARSRRHDPRSSKVASAQDPEGRKSQAQRILRWLYRFDTISADEAWRRLTEPGEDVTRGEWSARIGVLIHRGLVERRGERRELDRHGNARMVLEYRLTDVGRDETTRMFGGVA